ncbi:MarR family transcriptional regulator [Haloferax sp. MBLA0076]|uniref:MarR family transcriptional regulator n=1 Tax=Haloferax litoreum TaxID=2666140 RepID=A0A6A8GLC5_9EURY|nr:MULTISPECIES: MarR family transcriptional regulator [Haloferax]KAB1194355.1 MarR family transcriptional regulator [Haloferax sp. CBA1148]MRX22917.1 MarR family transcriptional regulator [Haloferax litoreum]
MGRSLARIAVAFVVLFSLVAGPLSTTGVAQAQTQPDVDNTVLRIEVHENASATWELQIRTRLRTSEQKAEYRAFQRRFENDTSAFLGPFATRINGTVDAASRATGREMNATDFSASTSIQTVPRQWGVVSYQFRWRNFTDEDDGRLVVGDVFESGLFIAENDTLEVVAPAEYRVASATPSATSREDGVLTWNGPETFADGEPLVVFEPRPVETTSVETTAAEPNGTNWQTIGGTVGAVFFVVFVAVGYWRRVAGDETEGEHERALRADEQTARGPRDVGKDKSHEAGAGHPDDGSPEHDGEVARDEVEDAGGVSAEDGVDDDVSVDPILTDEDRVQNLLRASDGRIRQKDVVTELDWSKSKVSRVLSRMEDDGTIEKLRLGRENVIELVSASTTDEDTD